ncbi:hypothetical protein EVAR_20888_1 [Eumeta japonica]|uniref:Uncharacterized protein n=1 Tax=Eumeta variegata TaxID=151549 RepID=A0A4C1UWP4_EUMVA|nr:hypothetical protein EVAR_20888_1 [Eumeta japonica]
MKICNQNRGRRVVFALHLHRKATCSMPDHRYFTHLKALKPTFPISFTLRPAVSAHANVHFIAALESSITITTITAATITAAPHRRSCRSRLADCLNFAPSRVALVQIQQ